MITHSLLVTLKGLTMMPGLSPGAGVYLVIRGTLSNDGDGSGPREVVLSYGDGRTVRVSTAEPGVYLIPEVAARALAVCMPV